MVRLKINARGHGKGQPKKVRQHVNLITGYEFGDAFVAFVAAGISGRVQLFLLEAEPRDVLAARKYPAHKERTSRITIT